MKNCKLKILAALAGLLVFGGCAATEKQPAGTVMFPARPMEYSRE